MYDGTLSDWAYQIRACQLRGKLMMYWDQFQFRSLSAFRQLPLTDIWLLWTESQNINACVCSTSGQGGHHSTEPLIWLVACFKAFSVNLMLINFESSGFFEMKLSDWKKTYFLNFLVYWLVDFTDWRALKHCFSFDLNLTGWIMAKIAILFQAGIFLSKNLLRSYPYLILDKSRHLDIQG